jgi:hypothetical protein
MTTTLTRTITHFTKKNGATLIWRRHDVGVNRLHENTSANNVKAF